MKKLFLCIVIFILIGSPVIYFAGYYTADDSVLEYSYDEESYKNLIVLEADSDVGIIFYPGAKVATSAYVPLFSRLRDYGITCILVDMPLGLAVLQPNAADKVINSFTNIDKWYIAGHSLGGAMASTFYSENEQDIEGLILLGAYPYGEINLENTLTIYGSEDMVLTTDKIDYTDNVYVIEGGNHAQFGNYGIQKGDGISTILHDEQQDETSKLILEFIGK